MYGSLQDRSPSREETRLPRGVCRFILLHPELTGQRCSCQGYSLNTSAMGSSCECGHQACYHVPEQENESLARQELNTLLARVVNLERQLERERSGRTIAAQERIIAMEEALENHKAEQEENTKTMYRAMAGAYNNIRHYQVHNSKRFLEYDDKIDSIADKVFAFGDDLGLVQRHAGRMEDTITNVEERLEDIESEDDHERVDFGRPRKRAKMSPQERGPPATPPPGSGEVTRITPERSCGPSKPMSASESRTETDVLLVDEATQITNPQPFDVTFQGTEKIIQSREQSDSTNSAESTQLFRPPPIPRASSQTPTIRQAPPEAELPLAVPPSPSLTPIDLNTPRSPILPKRKSDLPSPPRSVSLTPDEFDAEDADFFPTRPLPPPPPPPFSTTSSVTVASHPGQPVQPVQPLQPVQPASATGSPLGFNRATVCRTAPGVASQGMCEGQSRRGVV